MATDASQRRWIEKVQTRLQVTSGFLDDIKAVKMMGLSQTMRNVIQNLRIQEIKTSEVYRKFLAGIIVLGKQTQSNHY
jgi:ATP-binding cassette, subfamily C (CFTR/MRP), member 1